MAVLFQYNAWLSNSRIYTKAILWLLIITAILLMQIRGDRRLLIVLLAAGHRSIQFETSDRDDDVTIR